MKIRKFSWRRKHKVFLLGPGRQIADTPMSQDEAMRRIDAGIAGWEEDLREGRPINISGSRSRVDSAIAFQDEFNGSQD